MALQVEELEQRLAPSTTSIGSLVGRAYFSGHAAANRDNGDIYHFDISPQDPLVSSEQLDDPRRGFAFSKSEAAWAFWPQKWLPRPTAWKLSA